MSGTWYHGSPLEIAILRQGSTITQDPDLARAFSHKPTLLSITDEGRIQHNGTAPGFLYQIDEEIRPGDLEPHPRTTMEPGQEWLTTRDLRLSLVERVGSTSSERLTEGEIEALRQHMQNPCPRKTNQRLAARAQDCPDRIGESRLEGPDDGLGPGTAPCLSQVHRQNA